MKTVFELLFFCFIFEKTFVKLTIPREPSFHRTGVGVCVGDVLKSG